MATPYPRDIDDIDTIKTGDSHPKISLCRHPEIVVGKKYRLLRRIGAGSQSVVYLAMNIFNGKEVAIKCEPSNKDLSQLIYESKLYKLLQGGIGIPKIHWNGLYFHKPEKLDINFLVMDLLGPSIEDFFQICQRRFTLKTVLMLADQMISRMEYLHSKDFIHRSVKPEDFLMGVKGSSNIVHLIDYGFSKRFQSQIFKEHIGKNKRVKYLHGSPNFDSVNVHSGMGYSRRDDMVSIGYILMYFNLGGNCKFIFEISGLCGLIIITIIGVLPWRGLKAATKKEKYEKICEMKMSTPLEVLCHGFPEEFAIYLNYCRRLHFEEKPDYKNLRRLFHNLFLSWNYKYDYNFDWVLQIPRKITNEKEAKLRAEKEAKIMAKNQLEEKSCEIEATLKAEEETNNQQEKAREILAENEVTIAKIRAEKEAKNMAKNQLEGKSREIEATLKTEKETKNRLQEKFCEIEARGEAEFIEVLKKAAAAEQISKSKVETQEAGNLKNVQTQKTREIEFTIFEIEFTIFEIEAKIKAQEESKRQAEFKAQRKAEEEEAKLRAEKEAKIMAKNHFEEKLREIEATLKTEEEKTKNQVQENFCEIEARGEANMHAAYWHAEICEIESTIFEIEAKIKAKEESKGQAEIKAQQKAEEEEAKFNIIGSPGCTPAPYLLQLPK